MLYLSTKEIKTKKLTKYKNLYCIIYYLKALNLILQNWTKTKTQFNKVLNL